jgi:hypothetical protein
MSFEDIARDYSGATAVHRIQSNLRNARNIWLNRTVSAETPDYLEQYRLYVSQSGVENRLKAGCLSGPNNDKTP